MHLYGCISTFHSVRDIFGETVRSLWKILSLSAIFFFLQSLLFAHDDQFHGQASGWFSSASSNFRFGLRYIPEYSFEHPITDDIRGDASIALNAFSTSQFSAERSPLYSGKIKPYRLYGRVSSDRFEARAGLQKINFGSAMLLRPLMWFDAIDPRDPLQLTDGVYALLLRYYFPANANVWLWGLYGNNDVKGMDISPSKKQSIEFGGRAQIPLWNGEIAGTYHHRTADLKTIFFSNTFSTEDRYALDGKWDIGIGVWFESALTHSSIAIAGSRYRRSWMLGTDYTFEIGNGLTVLTEYFRLENPTTVFAAAKGVRFSALSATYPLNIMDKISCSLYHDWTTREWYRLVSLQRTYDNWIIYLLGFWNPPYIQRSQPVSGQMGNSMFNGKGIQMMAVFNH